MLDETVNTICKNCGRELEGKEIGRRLCFGCSWAALAAMTSQAVAWEEQSRQHRLSCLWKQQRRQLSEYLNSWDGDDE